MKTSALTILICLILIFSGKAQEYPRTDEYSGNPLFDELFTADASALVYNDTLYLFTGHDEAAAGVTSFTMYNWHIFSTADMINWTDHGAVLNYTDFSWASCCAFAGHCTEHNGKFYWYVPMVHKNIKAGEGFAIGVAVAGHPAGPYEATDYILISDATSNSVELNIDPCVYVDDDGQIYLYWGSWNACRYVKLKDNMVETDGAVQTVNAQGFFEAPYIHKYNDTYYFSYSTGYPSRIAYSTSSSITGPWTYQGIINDYVENSETNHQAIIEFKNQWYFVYHNGALPNGGIYRRSVCIDTLGYDGNGKIIPIVQTDNGVRGIATNIEDCNGETGGGAFVDSCGECVGGSTGKEACTQDCNGDWGGTAYFDTCSICAGGESGNLPSTGCIDEETTLRYDGTIESANEGYNGTGYLNFSNEFGAAAQWNICSDSTMTATLTVRYANGTDASRGMSVAVNGTTQIKEIIFPSSSSWTQWQSVEIPLEFIKGRNTVELSSLTDDGGPNIDLIAFSTNNLHDCSTNAAVTAVRSSRRNEAAIRNGTVSYYLEKSTPVTVSLFSVSGRRLHSVFNGTGQPGINTVRFTDKPLAAGVYFLTVNIEGTADRKAVYIHR